jgi:transcription elongation factor Elf1
VRPLRSVIRPEVVYVSYSTRRRGTAVAQRKTSPTDVRRTPTEPITCSHCGGQAYLMRRTLHPKIKAEIWTFECKDCGKQTEKSVLH